jgi:hypothetical protein
VLRVTQVGVSRERRADGDYHVRAAETRDRDAGSGKLQRPAMGSSDALRNICKGACRKLHPARGCRGSRTAQVSIPRTGVGTEGVPVVLELGLSLAGAGDCQGRVLEVPRRHRLPAVPEGACCACACCRAASCIRETNQRCRADSKFVGDATETCFNLSGFRVDPN